MLIYMKTIKKFMETIILMRIMLKIKTKKIMLKIKIQKFMTILMN